MKGCDAHKGSNDSKLLKIKDAGDKRRWSVSAARISRSFWCPPPGPRLWAVPPCWTGRTVKKANSGENLGSF